VGKFYILWANCIAPVELMLRRTLVCTVLYYQLTMFKYLLRNILFIAIFLSESLLVTAQKVIKEPTVTDPEWAKPYPPFRIAGNLYYVGTYDLDVISLRQHKEIYSSTQDLQLLHR
jgi:hypothetical protein